MNCKQTWVMRKFRDQASFRLDSPFAGLLQSHADELSPIYLCSGSRDHICEVLRVKVRPSGSALTDFYQTLGEVGVGEWFFIPFLSNTYLWTKDLGQFCHCLSP